MPNREEQQHRTPRDVPPVGRPRGAIWRTLQADGVVWEGQVQLVGDDLDLAARMIVTHRRVVFVRGGELVLDIARDWLRPEPVLRRDGVLDLFVAMPGGNLFDEPMRVPLRMREGHPAAGHIIALLAPSGVRRISAETLSGMERAREAAPAPRFGGFWDESETGEPFEGNGIVFDRENWVEPEHSSTNGAGAPDWAPIEPPDRVVRSSSTPARRPVTSGYPITGLQPRDQRRSSWGLLLRVGALVLLLATAAALGAGRLNIGAPGGGSGAVLTAPTPTVPLVASPAAASESALVPDDATVIATGVGGAAAQATADETATAEAGESASGSAAGTAATPALVPTAAVIPTPAPTSAAPTETEAPAIIVPTPDATAVTQPAAVAADDAPAQEIVVGPLRLAVSTALRAESLPRYGLPPGSGEWVLMIVDITNEGSDPVSLAMSDFRLFDRGAGTTADLDSGTDVIAGLAGFDPARSSDDSIAVAPGEMAETLLLYLLPPGSSDDVAVLVGETAMDLAPLLELSEAAVADAPELVQATVTQVLDGSRIVVDIGGARETVQYLGMQAPTGDACFAAEAAAANTQLLEGQTVWLEREATDRGPDDILVRDVWIAESRGARALVAARLVTAGAGAAAPAAPDTRYAAWLQAATALARTNGAGMWGACPEATASAKLSPMDAPGLAFMTGGWRD